MLYLCEVTNTGDPQRLNRVKAYILAEGGLGESEWMFCAVQKFPKHLIDPSYKEYPEFPEPKVGDLVWASLVNQERNVYAWHSVVPADQKDATLNLYNDFLDTTT